MTPTSPEVELLDLESALRRGDRVTFVHGPDHYDLMRSFFDKDHVSWRFVITPELGNPQYYRTDIVHLVALTHQGRSAIETTLFGFTGSIKAGDMIPRFIEVSGEVDTENGTGYLQAL